MIVLIDNGHGKETAGKRSVDGTLLEWEYTRIAAKKIVAQLLNRGIKAQLLTPEENDVSLAERVKRANKIHAKEKAILVSIHCNAEGYGQNWGQANGWSAFVSPQAGASSRVLAEILADNASRNGMRVRRPKPTQDYWEKDLYICNRTKCPAVLTENLFMTNQKDVELLLSDAGMQLITLIHVTAIVDYIKRYNL